MNLANICSAGTRQLTGGNAETTPLVRQESCPLHGTSELLITAPSARGN